MSMQHTNIEHLNEGWVKFIRVACKEGYIDRFIGDSAENPNNTKRSNISLNSCTEYYRLNGGEWLNKSCFKRDFLHDLVNLRHDCTAQEIWETYIS